MKKVFINEDEADNAKLMCEGINEESINTDEVDNGELLGEGINTDEADFAEMCAMADDNIFDTDTDTNK